jgi:hypothetical protein
MWLTSIALTLLALMWGAIFGAWQELGGIGLQLDQLNLLLPHH